MKNEIGCCILGSMGSAKWAVCPCQTCTCHWHCCMCLLSVRQYIYILGHGQYVVETWPGQKRKEYNTYLQDPHHPLKVKQHEMSSFLTDLHNRLALSLSPSLPSHHMPCSLPALDQRLGWRLPISNAITPLWRLARWQGDPLVIIWFSLSLYLLYPSAFSQTLFLFWFLF